MYSERKIINICNRYKNGDFDIEEFQQRLETVYLPEKYRNTLEIKQHNAFNYLEKIRFSYFEEEQKKHADKVADDLIKAVKLYIEK